MSIAIIKHGGPAALREKMLPRRHDLPQHGERLDRVLEMIDNLKPSPALRLKWACQPLPRNAIQYVRKGSEFEERARQAIQRMSEFEIELQNMSQKRRSIATRNDCRHFYNNIKHPG